MLRLRWLSKKKNPQKKTKKKAGVHVCMSLFPHYFWASLKLDSKFYRKVAGHAFSFHDISMQIKFSDLFSHLFFFLWLVLQLTRCCGSLPILFPSLLLQGDNPDYLRLCCFQVPHICCTLEVFLFFTYSDIILHRLSSFSGSNNLAESLQSQYSCSGRAEVTQLHMGQVLHHHSSINYFVRSQNI